MNTKKKYVVDHKRLGKYIVILANVALALSVITYFVKG